MAHFSEMKDELDASKIKIPQGCRNNGFFVTTKLRSLFDQVLSYFLKCVSVNKNVIRVFPPKLCDGVQADLFTLFWVVRKIGSYELVSKNELWEFVADECGLDVTQVGSLKLIYVTYLKELDQWLSGGYLNDMKLEDLGVNDKLNLLFRELSRVGFENNKGKCACIESSDGIESERAMEFNGQLDLDMAKTEKGLSRINNVDEKNKEFGGLDLNIAKSEMGFPRFKNVYEKDEEFGDLDLNIATNEMGFSRFKNVDEKNEEFGGLNLNIAKIEMGFSRFKNVDEKSEEFDGLDLNIARNEMGFSRINNVDERDGNFGGLDLNMVKTETWFSRINNLDEKNEEFGGLDLNIASSEIGSSRINDVKEKDEEFCCLDLDMAKTEIGFSRINNLDENFGVSDEKTTESLSEIVVNKVDVSRIKDDAHKRALLCPMNILSSRSNNNDHNDTSDNDNNTMIFAKTIVENVVSSQKRKKDESLLLSKMLYWVTNAARNPHDVTIGSVPNSSKWKKYNSNVVWKQVLLVKETLFAKRTVDSSNKVYGSQKKRHMMHPSMYDDDKIPFHLASKRIRCSQRVSSVKSCSCPGCTSCSSSRNKRPKPDVKKTPQIPDIIEIEDDVCEDLETDIVPLGAEVPEWTGIVSESDPKWLGTRMWPLPDDRILKQETGRLVIGKGRQSWCRCSFPGSAECVRIHIAKNRRRVRKTLGSLFYKWKFNRMGEEASICLWSVEEETEFKRLVIKARQELTDKSKSRHEIMSNFWRRASESIPLKGKDLLVSYYFNVFVLRRRRYQNRSMPENIDSDDDEQELGCEKIGALQCTDVES